MVYSAFIVSQVGSFSLYLVTWTTFLQVIEKWTHLNKRAAKSNVAWCSGHCSFLEKLPVFVTHNTTYWTALMLWLKPWLKCFGVHWPLWNYNISIYIPATVIGQHWMATGEFCKLWLKLWLRCFLHVCIDLCEILIYSYMYLLQC